MMTVDRREQITNYEFKIVRLKIMFNLLIFSMNRSLERIIDAIKHLTIVTATK